MFCGLHSQKQANLDQECRFHPRGHPSRVCDVCYESAKSEATSWIYSSVPPSRQTSIVEEIVVEETPRLAVPRQSSVVTSDPAPLMSVPSDWQWSTF